MRGRMMVMASMVAVVPLVTTCGDTILGPEGGEVVALASLGEQELPVTLEEAPGYERVYLADTIHLGSNGRWSRRQLQDFSPPGQGFRRLDLSSDGTIERIGGEIVLDFVCHDTGLCVAPDRLIPDVGGYRIERQVTVDSVIIFRYWDIGLGGGEQ